jgi:hypothetical protein
MSRRMPYPSSTRARYHNRFRLMRLLLTSGFRIRKWGFMSLFSKSIPKPIRMRILWLAGVLAILPTLWSCQLSQNAKVENTADFDQQYETLSQFDSVVIVFRDPQGKVMDTVVNGKVDSHSKLHDLEVEGWDGGQVQILVSGFNAGKLVYQVEKRFDGKTNQTDANTVLLLPDAAIHSDIQKLDLAEGDSLKYPPVTVGPAELTDKTVTWSSSDPEVLRAGADGVKGLKAGAAELTAHLKSAQTVTMGIKVTVVSRGVLPESLSLERDILYLVAGGPSRRLALNSHPANINVKVDWSIEAISIAKVDTAGNVSGLSKGITKLTATSKANPMLSASAIIVVGLDTLKPNPPVLTGPATTSLSPAWHWATGGGEGSGDFRYKLGDGDFTSGATLTRDTSFTLKSGLASGSTYTLFVAERDQAGNWSDAAKAAVKYDITKPVLTLTSPSLAGGTLFANASSVNLSGTVVGPSTISSLIYAVGSGAAIPVSLKDSAWTITGVTLTEGMPVNVIVTATDETGNSGSLVLPILMDKTPPTAPAFVIVPTTPTKATSGSWTWSAGGDGSNGSGLNGHFRFALNSGAWKDTTGLGVGNLVLLEGNNVLAVQEQDRSGLWSASGTSLVKVDLTAPNLSILSHSNPATLTTTHITLTVSASDTGSGVQSVTVAGQTAGNGVLTNANGTWTSAELSLKGGANSLEVTATDQVGNSRNLTFTVIANVPAAAVIITDPAANTITNADSIDVSYTIDGALGKKRFALVEGPNTLKVSSPPNASGAVGIDSVKVIRDATAPKAPTLAINASNTNGTATWTWSSNGDNTGGAGVKIPAAFRYSFNGGSTWTATSSTSTAQTTEGVYSLVVQEQDKAGNWSTSSAAKVIAVDKTAPEVTIQTPNNYITNKDSVTIRYTEKDSGKAAVSKTKAVSLSTDNGANNVMISSVADAAGNVGSASITVYRRSKVVFVKTTASGSGDGSSWENAAGGLSTGITKAPVGGQIWLAEGTYKTPSASGFRITRSTWIYGGFDANGTAFSISQRDSTLPNKTLLVATNSVDTILNVGVWEDPPVADFRLNAVQVSGLGTGSGAYGVVMYNTKHFELGNSVFQQIAQNALNIVLSQGVVYGCMLQYNRVAGQVVVVSLNADDNAGVTFQKCIFQHNELIESDPHTYAIIYFADGGTLTFNSCSLLDSFQNSESSSFFQLSSNAPYRDAVVTFKNSTVNGGLIRISHLGTLNYSGLGNTPP